MELRYCEECGDVIRLESDEPASLHEHFLCPRCKGGGGAPAAQARAAPQPGRTETFSAEDLDAALSQEPEPVAVLITRPTYYGLAAEVSDLVAVCRRRGVPHAQVRAQPLRCR